MRLYSLQQGRHLSNNQCERGECALWASPLIAAIVIIRAHGECPRSPRLDHGLRGLAPPPHLRRP